MVTSRASFGAVQVLTVDAWSASVSLRPVQSSAKVPAFECHESRIASRRLTSARDSKSNET